MNAETTHKLVRSFGDSGCRQITVKVEVRIWTRGNETCVSGVSLSTTSKLDGQAGITMSISKVSDIVAMEIAKMADRMYFGAHDNTVQGALLNMMEKAKTLHWKAMNEATFRVVVAHPTNFHSGAYKLIVRPVRSRDGQVYISGESFGCSRDYDGTLSDCSQAIRAFMSEHACTVSEILRMDE